MRCVTHTTVTIGQVSGRANSAEGPTGSWRSPSGTTDAGGRCDHQQARIAAEILRTRAFPPSARGRRYRRHHGARGQCCRRAGGLRCGFDAGTGLQGDVPAAERDSGRSSSGYSCNISRLGAYEGRGAGIVSASFDHCVYLGSFFPGNMLDQAQGVQVLDVTDHEGPRTGIIAGGDLSMPGMATMAELDALAASRGPDAEILFLQLMERHHRGGIAMGQAADRNSPTDR